MRPFHKKRNACSCCASRLRYYLLARTVCAKRQQRTLLRLPLADAYKLLRETMSLFYLPYPRLITLYKIRGTTHAPQNHKVRRNGFFGSH
jgi:hypothetical protein